MKHTKDSKLVRWLTYGIFAIFLLMPIHTILTTWAGANFGHIDIFRIWKELLLALLAVGTLGLVTKVKKLRELVANNKLVAMICLYILLHLVIGIIALRVGQVNRSALIYAWLINLRFLVFFLVCWLLSTQATFLRRNWKKIVIIPASIVIVFGFAQLVLPNNFLTHFGYGPDTIPAIHTVDQKLDYQRLQSTLRGPNPLGAYLIIVISMLSAFFIKYKKQRKKYSLGIFFAVIVMFFSYSRSAWLGLFTSMFILLMMFVENKQTRIKIVAATSSILLVIVAMVAIWQTNSVISNTVFHTSSTSKSLDSSNEARTQALDDGINSVIEKPLGSGPGTAGPASFRNSKTPRIAENYYLQIAQEVGLVGLLLFVHINLSVAKLLWGRRGGVLPIVLLATLFGLTLVNMLSHAWADDTLSYLWWGLAGLALANGTSRPVKRQSR